MKVLLELKKKKKNIIGLIFIMFLDKNKDANRKNFTHRYQGRGGELLLIEP